MVTFFLDSAIALPSAAVASHTASFCSLWGIVPFSVPCSIIFVFNQKHKTLLQQLDQQHIWHPYTHQQNALPNLPITSGKGSLLFDENNHAYIDAISSWWVNIHGHAHPYIAQKMYEQALQLEHVMFAGFTHAPAVQLAERLLPLLPGQMNKIFYSDNGSTAVEVALKMGIQYWQNTGQPHRNKIVAFTNSYHGDTFGAMSVSQRGVFTIAFQSYLFEVVFIPSPTAQNLPETLQLIQEQGPQIACFIYEPLLQAAGGMLMYLPTHMDALLQAMQAQQIICIADEVMTGFGRTAKLFASLYMQTQPHIVCLSKALTGGTLAMGITACAASIYQAFVSSNKTKTLFHGHSFTANPLSCAAALASLDLLQKEDCQAAIQTISQSHQAFIGGLQQPYKSIQNLRSLGTILAFEIAQPTNNYLLPMSTQIFQFALEQGVVIRPLGNTVYIVPPYCITPSQLKKTYQLLQAIMEAFG